MKKVKFLTDRNGKTIVPGSVVHYKDGWQKVKSVYVGSQSVNLCGIFGSRITERRLSVDEIYEDYENWSARWAQSEAYRCM